jgi:hypothetical protein
VQVRLSGAYRWEKKGGTGQAEDFPFIYGVRCAMRNLIIFTHFKILLHIRFPWWHDLCTILHFHSNVTVLLHNNGFVAVTQH